MHFNVQFANGLIERQNVRSIAVGINLRMYPRGRTDVPVDDVLTRIAARCQAQQLDQVRDGVFVVVMGIVNDVKTHNGSIAVGAA